MEKSKKEDHGIKLLIRRYRERFRIPENLNHYSREDYQAAEKKYVKMCVLKGECR